MVMTAETPTRSGDARELPRAERVRITEIFHSLQGEARTVGWPTVFIRLTGCPLRCTYCDTEYAFYGGQWLGLDEVVEQTRAYGARYVTVTGGEPLAQPNVDRLIHRLADEGWEVSVETSGAMDIGVLDERIVRVVDLKTPGSGELARNRWENLDLLRPQDQVKFVICDRADYEWARRIVREQSLADRCEVLFSPEHEHMSAPDLAAWILEDGLPVRFQVQLHKYLWGDVPGR